MTADAFLAGAAVMASFLIGLKFVKYWRLSRDGFFLWFAAAFWMFAIGWVMRTALPDLSEHAYLLYLPRLLAFLMIAIAILAKNRKPPE